MKKKLIITPLLLLMVVAGFAQGGNKRAEIEAQRVAYITKQVQLTPEEAQQFWPVYNEHQDKLKAVKKQRRNNQKQLRQNFDGLSEKEVAEALNLEMELRQQEAALNAEYHQRYMSILPAKKVARLYHAEDQFKKVLLKKMKENRAGGR